MGYLGIGRPNRKNRKNSTEVAKIPKLPTCAQKLYLYQHALIDKFRATKSSDGFSTMQTVRPHRFFPKNIKSPHLFFDSIIMTVAPSVCTLFLERK